MVLCALGKEEEKGIQLLCGGVWYIENHGQFYLYLHPQESFGPSFPSGSLQRHYKLKAELESKVRY